MDLFQFVGEKLRELREGYDGGRGLSQDALARELDLAPNTISRWETAIYHPSIENLDSVARFFGVSILEFFPREQTPADEKVSALLRVAKQLTPNDLEELRRYAEFRRARQIYGNSGRPRVGRKRRMSK